MTAGTVLFPTEHRPHAAPRVRIAAPTRAPRRCPAPHRLARYADAGGRRRELVVCPAPDGGRLVIDRDLTTLGDSRLVAHLAADEPPANAVLICRRYLADPRRGRPRPVTAEDLGVATAAVRRRHPDRADDVESPAVLADASGATHRLELVSAGAIAIPELRWTRREGRSRRVVSLRDVIGHLEDYEPARELTARAVAARRRDPRVSVSVLRAELERMGRSRIVLNRGLREAVVRVVAQEGVSMSAIASRCGRVKRDRRGNLSGETSWLARRLGLAPEGGEQRPTPWIHSDVLALIARAGLGLAPREVELG